MKRRTLLTTAFAAAFTPLNAATPRAPTGYIRTNWSADPFTLGSYSYIAKGARQRDTGALGKPVGTRLFFAGEATHPSYNSTVHAAYESGVFAAQALAQTDARTVAIIGAGISGHAAAYALGQSGQTVTMLEARDRIGGRLWTDDRLGTPLDLGASWIHGTTDNPIAALANGAGIATIRTDASYVVRDGQGQVMPASQEPDWLAEYTEIQQGLGAASTEINLRAYWHDRDYGGAEVVFPQGYGQILKTLRSPADIQLRWQAKEIKITDTSVAVSNTDGATLGFDAVIVTVPLGVLKAGSITFDPPLPRDKMRAINRLGMGLLDKVYLRFDDVFWDQDPTWIITPDAGLPRGQFLQWFNMAKFVDAPILMAFNGAEPARDLARLSDAEVLARAAQALNSAYP